MCARLCNRFSAVTKRRDLLVYLLCVCVCASPAIACNRGHRVSGRKLQQKVTLAVHVLNCYNNRQVHETRFIIRDGVLLFPGQSSNDSWDVRFSADFRDMRHTITFCVLNACRRMGRTPIFFNVPL